MGARIDGEQMRVLLERGDPYAAIVQALGCSRASISLWVRKLGLRRRDYPKPRIDHARILELVKLGWSHRDVAEEVKCSKETVDQVACGLDVIHVRGSLEQFRVFTDAGLTGLDAARLLGTTSKLRDESAPPPDARALLAEATEVLRLHGWSDEKIGALTHLSRERVAQVAGRRMRVAIPRSNDVQSMLGKHRRWLAFLSRVNGRVVA